MRVVFMGTPEFAKTVLDSLIEEGYDVAAVITQPDKPKGRGRGLEMPPVKVRAAEAGITVYQPEKIRKNKEFLDILRDISPDVIVVVAFGQILPKAVLELPRYGCVNVHASLLPMYRGAAPIQRVIIDGEKVSGVTTMLMDTGIDTGDMLLKEEIPIEPKETYGSYHDKLAKAGAGLLIRTLKGIEEGGITPVKQEGETCYAAMIDKTTAHIDWSASADKIECLVRGMNPNPGAYTHIDGKTLKIWDADICPYDEDERDAGKSDNVKSADDVESTENFGNDNANNVNNAVNVYGGSDIGKIVNITKNSFEVMTGKGRLKINELQLEGKKRMDAGSFLRGYRITEGSKLI